MQSGHDAFRRKLHCKGLSIIKHKARFDDYMCIKCNFIQRLHCAEFYHRGIQEGTSHFLHLKGTLEGTSSRFRRHFVYFFSTVNPRGHFIFSTLQWHPTLEGTSSCFLYCKGTLEGTSSSFFMYHRGIQAGTFAAFPADNDIGLSQDETKVREVAVCCSLSHVETKTSSLKKCQA